MSFSIYDISGMLAEYEADNNTGMEIDKISELLFDYTSGYPFLVSRLCMLMDEDDKNWTKDGFLKAVKKLLDEKFLEKQGRKLFMFYVKPIYCVLFLCKKNINR